MLSTLVMIVMLVIMGMKDYRFMGAEIRIILTGCLIIIVLSLGVMYQRNLSLRADEIGGRDEIR